MFEGEIPTKKYYFPQEPQKMEYFDYWKHQQEARKNLEAERVGRRKKLLESLGENTEDKLLEMLAAFDRSDFSQTGEYMGIMEMDADDLDLVEDMETDADDLFGELAKKDKYYDSREPLPRYNLKSIYLDLLAEVGTQKTVDYVVKFIANSEKSMLLAYREQILKILSNVDADYARQKMQELGNSEEKNVRERANYFSKREEMTAFQSAWLDEHLKNSTQSERIRVMEFVERYGEDGLKCLVFSEKEKGMEERIIKVGLEKELAHQEAHMLFAKISEILDKTEDNLARLLGDDQYQLDFNQVKSKLVERAKSVVMDFLQLDTKDENRIRKLLDDLENSKIQIDILSALLKTAKEQNIPLTPKNIRDMKMETYEVGELTGDKATDFRRDYEKPVMEMMRKSYEKIFVENPEARAKVENNFRERFENLEKYRVYVLTFKFDGVEEAVAFSVIDPNNTKDCEEGEVMSESTVVHPDVQKGAMGIEFLKKIFEQELEKYGAKAIRGKVRAGHPAGASYDRIGLVVDKSRPTWVEEGVEYESRIARKEQNDSGQETLNRQ